jgi:hypothetical protein
MTYAACSSNSNSNLLSLDSIHNITLLDTMLVTPIFTLQMRVCSQIFGMNYLNDKVVLRSQLSSTIYNSPNTIKYLRQSVRQLLEPQDDFDLVQDDLLVERVSRRGTEVVTNNNNNNNNVNNSNSDISQDKYYLDNSIGFHITTYAGMSRSRSRSVDETNYQGFNRIFAQDVRISNVDEGINIIVTEL